MRAVLATPLAGDACLRRREAPLPCGHPDGDTLPGEALCRLEGEPRPTDKAIAMDGPQQLGAAKELPQPLGLNAPPSKPAEDLAGRARPIGTRALGPVGRRGKGCEERRLLLWHVFSRVGLRKMGIGEAPLPLQLGFHQVLPGWACLDRPRLHFPVTPDGQGILRRKHAAVLGDPGVRTAVCRQGRAEERQEGRQGLLWRRHPSQHLPRIAFAKTDALAPAPRELEEGAPLRAPQGRAVRRAIGEGCEAGHLGLRLASTLPGPGGPRALAIAGHRSPHGALTRGRLLPLLPQYPMDAQPAGTWRRFREVEDLFEHGQAPLIFGMLRRPRALVLSSCAAIAFKGRKHGRDMRARPLEAVRAPLCVPALLRHPASGPARLGGLGKGRKGRQATRTLPRRVVGL